MTYGPPCPFRAIGFTWKAGLNPRTPESLSIVAQHNGVPVDRLPWAMRYAPNPLMLAWTHRLGVMQAKGHDVRPDGRWLTMKELDNL